MPALAERRLAGIRFERIPPALSEQLPRMDIAVFVGFASAGPLHQPVPIEDIPRFREIFGDDVTVAWDTVRNEPLCANLAPAVRAFFDNGGARCWVIRVAGVPKLNSPLDKPETNSFPLPGLAQWPPKESEVSIPAPTQARARSPGSWFDSFQCATALASSRIEVIENLGENFTQLQVRIAAGANVIAGDLLRFTFAQQPFETFFVVDEVIAAKRNSLPRHHMFTLVGRQLAWRQLPANKDALSKWSRTPGAAIAPQKPRAEVLTFDLQVRRGANQWRINELGFTPEHPRYWNALPTDEKLFIPTEPGKRVYAPEEHADQSWQAHPDLWRRASKELWQKARAELWRQAIAPRFPLAGNGSETQIFLPDGMSGVFDQFAGAEHTHRTQQERDGLDDFKAQLFLDPGLIEHNSTNLLEMADALRYESQSPRPLLGIHSALEVEEATLIAVPDAVHRGWELSPPTVPPLPALSPPLPHPNWGLSDECDTAARQITGEKPRRDKFLSCDLKLLPPPTIRLADGPHDTGHFTLDWDDENPDDPTLVFVLEESGAPDFTRAKEIYRGGKKHHELLRPIAGHYYFRIRVEAHGETSNWSAGIVVQIHSPSAWRSKSEKDFTSNTLLDIQRALLRLCAARGDLLAVLSLPEHFRDDEALNHVEQLKSADNSAFLSGTEITMPFTAGESRVFTYGAIYHPWPVSHKEDFALQRVPPDGAAIGNIARRSLTRGAWIAPANEAWQNVVALAPRLDAGRHLDLLCAQINQVLQAPHGFLVLNEDTLASGEERELRPINVRRLLILLRRAALKLGVNYVFEPNDFALRRRVQRGFESLMDQLFVRGAFAGDTRAESYQVVTDDSINTPQRRDLGQFHVDLKVAPALPMTFITVRLVQHGDRGVIAEIL